MAETQTRVDEAEAIAAYNYAVFPPPDNADDFRRFPSLLQVGSKAPDFEATLLDGQRVRLSDYTRRGLTVLEFGSIT